MKRIVLIGASGFGKEVAYIIERINAIKPTYELVGFLDDGAAFNSDSRINGYPWLGPSDWIIDHRDEYVCNCTIGFPAIKGRIQRRLTEKGVCFETIIAPEASIAPYTEIGAGAVLYWHSIVSVNCKIGDGVLISGGVRIGHDSIVGDYTTIMAGTGISGCCSIGSEVKIGGHAFVIPGRKVGDQSTVAAGSIVFTNVKASTTVLGNPAKRMKELE